MGILAGFGFIVMGFLSVSLVIGGLLNLGGCGDEYKVSNWIQIVVGILLLIVAFVLL